MHHPHRMRVMPALRSVSVRFWLAVAVKSSGLCDPRQRQDVRANPSRLLHHLKIALVICARKNSPSCWRSVPQYHPARSAEGIVMPLKSDSASTQTPNG